MLLSLIYTLQGVAFGAAFLSTPLAIVAVLALPTVWTLLTSMITRVQDQAPRLDLNMVTAPLLAGEMAGKDWAQLATATGAWSEVCQTPVKDYLILYCITVMSLKGSQSNYLMRLRID